MFSGLTAVFAADIIEIMFNDFPNKFEEFRKYTREKKAKEQKGMSLIYFYCYDRLTLSDVRLKGGKARSHVVRIKLYGLDE